MKKISFLTEGAIGDIIKRATSDEERVEDNVSFMYPNDFEKYLKNRYKSLTLRSIRYYKGVKRNFYSDTHKLETIFIPLGYQRQQMVIYYKGYNIDYITITYTDDDILKILAEYFNISKYMRISDLVDKDLEPEMMLTHKSEETKSNKTLITILDRICDEAHDGIERK